MEQIITKKYIKKFLPTKPIILESGANKGVDTIKMLKHLDPIKIYAFEPVDYLYNKLVNNTKEFKDIIETFNIALSNKSGISDFYISSGESLAVSSLLKPVKYLEDHPDTKFTLTKINTITIDEWASKNNIKYIDFLWLDMQGAEIMALEKAQTIINKVKAIFIEASLKERFKNNPLVDDVKNFMHNYNFKLDCYDKIKNGKVNLLFVR